MERDPRIQVAKNMQQAFGPFKIPVPTDAEKIARDAHEASWVELIRRDTILDQPMLLTRLPRPENVTETDWNAMYARAHDEMRTLPMTTDPLVSPPTASE